MCFGTAFTPLSPLPGREGLGVGAAEALGGFEEDGLGHTVGILVHFAVPEADDGPSFLLEETGPGFVGRRVDMLAPIDFDDQPRLPAGEIAT